MSALALGWRRKQCLHPPKEFVGVRRPSCRVVGHTCPDQGYQLSVHPDCPQIVSEVRSRCLGELSRQKLVRDRTERVNIVARIGDFAVALLGTGVEGRVCATQETRQAADPRRPARFAHQSGFRRDRANTEVRDFDPFADSIHQDVIRLQVTMGDASPGCDDTTPHSLKSRRAHCPAPRLWAQACRDGSLPHLPPWRWWHTRFNSLSLTRLS